MPEVRYLQITAELRGSSFFAYKSDKLLRFNAASCISFE